jgi:hypothetical protein
MFLMSQDTGLHRSCKDQFYTRNDVAALCVDVLRKYVTTDVPWIEPSAGTGVFLRLVPHSIGYDIDPKDAAIQKIDFLQTEPPKGCVIFGNPPFGRQASLAKQFIRHAAKFAIWIGFILPRSFVKPSMQSAFPPNFHLLESIDLPKDSFIVNGNPYDVPCVFQVWKLESIPRSISATIAPNGFRFVKKTDSYSFAFRRVGINAGKCCRPSDTLSAQSHYFLQIDDETKIDHIVNASNLHTFPTNTTGPRSLSKHEATSFLNTAIADAPTRCER